MSYFAKRFQELCHHKKLTSDYQLAKLGHLNRDTISKIKNNPVLNPRQTTLEKIATAFHKKTGNSVDKELEELKKFWAEMRKIYGGKEKSKKLPRKQVWWIVLGIDKSVKEIKRNLSDLEDLHDIIKELEKKGKGPIWIKKMKQGSIALLLESSPEVLRRIESLYREGELRDLLGVPVLDLQATPEKRVNLSQWFEGVFAAGWERVTVGSDPERIRYAVRTEGTKIIDLGADLIGHSIILLVNLTRERENLVTIWLRVYPREETCLPLNLKLLVLEGEEVFQKVTARSADNRIQCQFDAEPGDKFDVRLVLGDATVTETFVV